MSKTHADSTFRSLTRHFGIATAEVLFFLPDHPHILQTFLWQTEDLFPEFPRICKFTEYWLEHIPARIHTVTVTHSLLIKKKELKVVRDMVYLN